MEPSYFPESNTVLGPPDGTSESLPGSDDGVQSMSVFSGVCAGGDPCIISHWKPTADDMAAMARGEGVWLVVLGKGMPPVCLQTEYPFQK